MLADMSPDDHEQLVATLETCVARIDSLTDERRANGVA
jgi:hypothetical protein